MITMAKAKIKKAAPKKVAPKEDPKERLREEAEKLRKLQIEGDKKEAQKLMLEEARKRDEEIKHKEKFNQRLQLEEDERKAQQLAIEEIRNRKSTKTTDKIINAEVIDWLATPDREKLVWLQPSDVNDIKNNTVTYKYGKPTTSPSLLENIENAIEDKILPQIGAVSGDKNE